MTAIMVVRSVLAFLVGYGMGLEHHVQNPWLLGLAVAAVPALIGWGFHRQSAMAYDAYFFLAILSAPRTLENFAKTPLEPTAALALAVG
ncbi:MAG: hypothetical protein P8090_18310 [Gammaproteobacteria bacterium]